MTSSHLPPENFLPPNFKLREWQQEFFDKFINSATSQLQTDPKDIQAFILHAFPGSGKSLVQLVSAKLLLAQGHIDYVVICVPSEYLQNQMEHDAQSYGLYLNKKNFKLKDHQQGIVTTYQKLSYVNQSTGRFKNAEEIAELCEHSRVLVCADEMHHLGTDKSWSQAFTIAFNQTKARLMTSGTPFRSDGVAIPWARYIDRKMDLSPPHAYSYGYGTSKWNPNFSALKSKVVRDLVIHPYTGTVKYKVDVYSGMTNQQSTAYFTHDISDNLRDTYADETTQFIDSLTSARRTAALECGTPANPYGTDFVKRMLIDADAQLTEIRRFHPWAGGLVVCKNVKHADAVAKALTHWTNHVPEVIHSDKGIDKATIQKFRMDKTPARKRWIVSVKMVSEGVDIPHLRTLVYLTDITAPMYWMQVIGRVLRVEPGLEWDTQTAHVYQYADGTTTDEDGNETSYGIKLYAETLMEEREATIRAPRNPDVPPIGPGPDPPLPPSHRVVSALHTDSANVNKIFQDEYYDNYDLDELKPLAIRLNMPAAKVAHLISVGGAENWAKAVNRTQGEDK